MAAPDPRDLAQIAYAAYGDSTGQRNYQGLPMPSWDDLTLPIQEAWTAAATAVRDAVQDPPNA